MEEAELLQRIAALIERYEREKKGVTFIELRPAVVLMLRVDTEKKTSK